MPPSSPREQGGANAAGATDWITIAGWLGTLPGSVLLCLENAEEPLRATSAQVHGNAGSLAMADASRSTSAFSRPQQPVMQCGCNDTEMFRAGEQGIECDFVHLALSKHTLSARQE